MADKYWVGTTGDHTVGSNWSDGTVPSANDDIYLNNDADMDGGTFNSGTATGHFFVTENYTGQVGSSTDILTLNGNGSNFVYQGQGNLTSYIKAGTSDYTHAIIDTPGNFSMGNTVASWLNTLIWVKNGNVTDGPMFSNELRITGGSFEGAGLIGTTDIWMTGGRVTADTLSTFTNNDSTIHQYGGIISFEDVGFRQSEIHIYRGLFEVTGHITFGGSNHYGALRGSVHSGGTVRLPPAACGQNDGAGKEPVNYFKVLPGGTLELTRGNPENATGGFVNNFGGTVTGPLQDLQYYHEYKALL